MKVYTRPIVSQVQLVIDQAVLGGCKTAGAVGGPQTGGVDCDYGLPGTFNDCLTKGS